LARPLLVAATVGEEGPGDLRGVKHLFRPGGPCEAVHGFVSVDGAGLRRIVTRAVGSRRYRVCVRGRGGHSWADFGTPNPIHALGRALAELAVAPLPSAPRATLTVARIGGGTAVNAIPMEAWAEVDTRSEDPAHLDALEALVRGACARGVAAERAAAQGARGELALEIEVMGDRPAGATDSDHPLVRAAERATRAVGVEPERVASSTDANVPMALGLPAVTVGGGGEAGGAHTTGEWYRNAGGPEGVVRLLLLVAAVAGRDPWPDANAEAAAPRVAAGEDERR
ncbi:MAG: M20/M25/M40 family metallo-hydrolase, partial [Gemmatimonadetes bacterium]